MPGIKTLVGTCLPHFSNAETSENINYVSSRDVIGGCRRCLCTQNEVACHPSASPCYELRRPFCLVNAEVF